MFVSNQLSFALTAMLVVAAASVVDARNYPTRAQKKELRQMARKASKQCRPNNNRIRVPIIHTNKCPDNESFEAIIAILDRQTRAELGTVKTDCYGKVHAVCEPHCDMQDRVCPEGSFCRFVEEIGISTCKAYAAIGESCGGYTLPGMESVCDPETSECVYPPQVDMIPDLPGTCQKKSDEKKCDTDADCGDNQWCQPKASGSARLSRFPSPTATITKTCTDYVGLNDSCGGFTSIEYLSKCNPATMVCMTEETLIADAPGKCKLMCDADAPCPSDMYCDDGICMDTCTEDDDCENDNYWCRATPNDGVSACALYVGPGEDCGPTKDAPQEERCAEFLICMPGKEDLTGTCQFPTV